MRARNIKPDFFRDYKLCQLDVYARLLFAGLWCLADKEGRLEDCPPRIRADVFPYDSVEVEKLLESLATQNLIVRYKDETGNFGHKSFIQISHFSKHQNPHKNEKPSEIPAVEDCRVITGQDRVIDGATRADSLIPDSLIPEYKTLYINELKKIHSESFGAMTMTKDHLDTFERWNADGKTIDQIKKAYQKTAVAKPATRWGWIVDIVDGEGEFKDGRKQHSGCEQTAHGKKGKVSRLEVPTGENIDYAKGWK